MTGEMAKCTMCGKMVLNSQLDPREKECATCRAEDRATEMSVGDIGSR